MKSLKQKKKKQKNKITEIILEPSKVYVGSTFRLKVKAVKYVTYSEIKAKETYNTLKEYSYNDLKGE